MIFNILEDIMEFPLNFQTSKTPSLFSFVNDDPYSSLTKKTKTIGRKLPQPLITKYLSQPLVWLRYFSNYQPKTTPSTQEIPYPLPIKGHGSRNSQQCLFPNNIKTFYLHCFLKSLFDLVSPFSY